MYGPENTPHSSAQQPKILNPRLSLVVQKQKLSLHSEATPRCIGKASQGRQIDPPGSVRADDEHVGSEWKREHADREGDGGESGGDEGYKGVVECGCADRELVEEEQSDQGGVRAGE